jgi:hypothetical protein
VFLVLLYHIVHYYATNFGIENIKKSPLLREYLTVWNYMVVKLTIMRIFAQPFSFNQASCRVLEKTGFEYEGTLRQNAVKNGRVEDMKMYALLRLH